MSKRQLIFVAISILPVIVPGLIGATTLPETFSPVLVVTGVIFYIFGIFIGFYCRGADVAEGGELSISINLTTTTTTTRTTKNISPDATPLPLPPE